MIGVVGIDVLQNKITALLKQMKDSDHGYIMLIHSRKQLRLFQ